jgi:hypothetical protein
MRRRGRSRPAGGERRALGKEGGSEGGETGWAMGSAIHRLNRTAFAQKCPEHNDSNCPTSSASVHRLDAPLCPMDDKGGETHGWLRRANKRDAGAKQRSNPPEIPEYDIV